MLVFPIQYLTSVIQHCSITIQHSYFKSQYSTSQDCALTLCSCAKDARLFEKLAELGREREGGGDCTHSDWLVLTEPPFPDQARLTFV